MEICNCLAVKKISLVRKSSQRDDISESPLNPPKRGKKPISIGGSTKNLNPSDVVTSFWKWLNSYGNLYKSDRNYYVLIDEINQKNGAGDKMLVLDARLYETIQAVENAKKKYEERKNKPYHSKHFFQEISTKYGANFPEKVSELTNELPKILNFDCDSLRFDSSEMAIVDEAIRWNHDNYPLFDVWFPSVFAYYGQCFIKNKKAGKWRCDFDKEAEIWIPKVIMNDGKAAFSSHNFYKSLFEWAIPMKWAGNWE